MKINKKTRVVLFLVVSVAFCVAAKPVKPAKPGYTNLKILPKHISSKALQGLMVDDFQDGLGVTCGFCHVDAQNGHGLDFASDAKPEKEISRAMMQMTIGINKRYFKQKQGLTGAEPLIVTCNTCHQGQAFPGGGAEQK